MILFNARSMSHRHLCSDIWNLYGNVIHCRGWSIWTRTFQLASIPSIDLWNQKQIWRGVQQVMLNWTRLSCLDMLTMWLSLRACPTIIHSFCMVIKMTFFLRNLMPCVLFLWFLPQLAALWWLQQQISMLMPLFCWYNTSFFYWLFIWMALLEIKSWRNQWIWGKLFVCSCARKNLWGSANYSFTFTIYQMIMLHDLEFE